ncbi:hypothetical protein EYF80_052511 [Liparis tanakae]|uniref:Uncharacterized protein n=1 Tax=Liparis tanakae TaxID=230148 RepID=A0A4Z2F872_9TELE|nr:hypothetical protein EYF80_052511 [Liparis tanakae]
MTASWHTTRMLSSLQHGAHWHRQPAAAMLFTERRTRRLVFLPQKDLVLRSAAASDLWRPAHAAAAAMLRLRRPRSHFDSLVFHAAPRQLYG